MPSLNELFGDEFGDQPQQTAEPAETVIAEKKDEPAVAEPKQIETSNKFRREIDLGDGSGKQVFEADTLEALVDKLTDAQTHATKKIQELSKPSRTRIRPETDAPVIKNRQLTADEAFELGIQGDPEEAFNKMLKKKFGDSYDANTVAGKFQAENEEAAQREFISSNPDFVPSAENAKHIYDFLKKEQLPLTKRNLDYAFQELKADGLFAKAPEQKTPETRIETQPTTTPKTEPQKRRSTGVPNDLGTTREVVRDSSDADYEAEVQKIYAEPNIDKARDMMNRLMQRKNK